MRIKAGMEEAWAKERPIHTKQESYDFYILEFLELWADKMEQFDGLPLTEEVYQTTSGAADEETSGMSGASFSVAAQTLIRYWYRGDELKPLYEKLH